MPKTMLTDLVMGRYSLQHPTELIPLVYGESFTRDAVGDVTRLVFEAARAGDSVGMWLLQNAADDLSHLVNVLLHRLQFSEPTIPVVATGGLFHQGSPLVQLVQERVGAAVQVMVGERPPVTGAVILAQKLSGDSERSDWANVLTQVT
jgi:N-acetylglucosamine kinase-like BadF-type ATPase